MWISKKKWGQIDERLELLEDVLAQVERGAHLLVVKRDSGHWTTAGVVGVGPNLGSVTQNISSVTISTLFALLLRKLNLQTDRSPGGGPIITEIPKAEGGTTGRAPDGRFAKKG